MCLWWFASGCRGDADILTEPEGLISINETEYRNSMTCGWKIRVDPSKVNDFKVDTYVGVNMRHLTLPCLQRLFFRRLVHMHT